MKARLLPAVVLLFLSYLTPSLQALADAPTVSAPTVSAPTVSAPTVSAPTVSAPTVGAPTAGAPGLQHPVSSSSPEARNLFDQGLFFIYAFNHDEAIRCFQEAARLDPEFALAHWGIALALGPNINLDMDPPRQIAAFAALQRAQALSSKASEPERAYIRALAKRYTGNPDEDLHKLATAYMEAMRELSQSYPDDPDAATLYAESLMDLHPWQLWSADGTPAPGTLETVAILESVLRRYPSHIGANHYYIHAVEASPHPEWALPSAQRIEAMQLSAGHLIHMPSHIYMRTGDYARAAECNVAAVAADQKYLESAGTGGIYSMMYYSHNLHFLAIARSMQGRFQEALGAAQELAGHVESAALAMPMLEFFIPTPDLVRVRFHKWQEILQSGNTLPEMPVAIAIRHFARGMAYAATGNLERARAERALFRESAGRVPDGASWDLNKGADVLLVAGWYLDARIARGAGDLAGAADLLKKGVAAEDALRYMEPPGWFLPLREPLGAVLLQQGDFAAAEKVFREELARNPRSGRALFGLWESLQGEGKAYAARLVQREYEAAWLSADGPLNGESL